MLCLQTLSRAAASLPAIQDHDTAAVFWSVYTSLVRVKTPHFQRRLMKLIGMDAGLQAASELFHATHNGTGLTFQMTSQRAPLPALVWVMDRHFRQVAGPFRATNEANAVLIATVEGAIYLNMLRSHAHAG
jgi:hypothetical protein